MVTQPPDNHWTSFDRQMMGEALAVAKKGQYTARPNPMVGCVVVKDKKVVGRGFHQKSGQAHAEINALAEAGNLAKNAICYVTLEPCAHTGKTGPCAKALVKAGIKKVIAAMRDPNPLVAGKGFQILLDAGIEVEFGLYQSQAMQLNRGFISRVTRGRPWVTCKLAMSVDGRTALANGASQWITGSAARADVQRLRARQDAIITGIGTVLADNPSLTVRAQDTDSEIDQWFAEAESYGFQQPARILLDRQQRANTQLKLFNDDTKVYWVSDKTSNQVVDEHIVHMPQAASLEDFLTDLGDNEIGNLLLESGQKLAGEFLRNGLIDELIIYMAPKLMGNQAKGLFDFEVINMADTPVLKMTDIRQIGDDIRLTYLLNEKLGG